jgi:hypothetical protein
MIVVMNKMYRLTIMLEKFLFNFIYHGIYFN